MRPEFTALVRGNPVAMDGDWGGPGPAGSVATLERLTAASASGGVERLVSWLRGVARNGGSTRTPRFHRPSEERGAAAFAQLARRATRAGNRVASAPIERNRSTSASGRVGHC